MAEKPEEKKKKPKKSRLGPILNPEDIGIERQVKISASESKTIIVDDKTPDENSQESEKLEEKKKIETGAETNLAEKLESLKKASGQDEIEQVTTEPDGVVRVSALESNLSNY